MPRFETPVDETESSLLYTSPAMFMLFVCTPECWVPALRQPWDGLEATAAASLAVLNQFPSSCRVPLPHALRLESARADGFVGSLRGDARGDADAVVAMRILVRSEAEAVE